MQFQADVLGIPVERPRVTETTAQGAFYFAALGAGMYGGVDELRRLREIERIFYPSAQKDETDKKYLRWQNAVERAKGWALP
jgi:glycerol kinase